jgi:hypothetical protein
MLMAMMGELFRGSRYLAELYMDTNPFVHVVAILEATVGELDTYDWFSFRGGNSMNLVESTVWIIVCTVGYIFLGFLFAWRAMCRFRCHIFE